jgi:hypothetical protein
MRPDSYAPPSTNKFTEAELLRYLGWSAADLATAQKLLDDNHGADRSASIDAQLTSVPTLEADRLAMRSEHRPARRFLRCSKRASRSLLLSRRHAKQPILARADPRVTITTF